MWIWILGIGTGAGLIAIFLIAIDRQTMMFSGLVRKAKLLPLFVSGLAFLAAGFKILAEIFEMLQDVAFPLLLWLAVLAVVIVILRFLWELAFPQSDLTVGASFRHAFGSIVGLRKPLGPAIGFLLVVAAILSPAVI